jgi:hypothetical protein
MKDESVKFRNSTADLDKMIKYKSTCAVSGFLLGSTAAAGVFFVHHWMSPSKPWLTAFAAGFLWNGEDAMQTCRLPIWLLSAD